MKAAHSSAGSTAGCSAILQYAKSATGILPRQASAIHFDRLRHPAISAAVTGGWRATLPQSGYGSVVDNRELISKTSVCDLMSLPKCAPTRVPMQSQVCDEVPEL